MVGSYENSPIPSSRQADWRDPEARDGMLLPMNFRETAIALQSNPNIRACVSIVEEELHKEHANPKALLIRFALFEPYGRQKGIGNNHVPRFVGVGAIEGQRVGGPVGKVVVESGLYVHEHGVEFPG